MYEGMKFFWGVIVALVSALWILTTFVRDRSENVIQRSNMLSRQLLEIDDLIIAKPELQQYLSRHATESEAWFCSAEVLGDPLFYQAKSLVYKHLNIFDSIVSTSASRSWLPWLSTPLVLELGDWENYIKKKLNHPLYRCILHNELDIFGKSFKAFWKANEAAISLMRVDPHSW